MQNSRTKNSIINSSVSVLSEVLLMIVNFVVKTIFIYVLGKEYLGLSGLFTNIITMLSLVELGIGIALPYSLYKPLAEENTEEVKSLMKYYKKIYNIIGVIVLGIGLSLVPFLQHIIKEIPDITNTMSDLNYVRLIYSLFVIHSALSYFFVYKRYLIVSDQKGYVVEKINFGFSIFLAILQVVVLFATRSYVLFLLASIFNLVIMNLYISNRADKLYPYLKDKDVKPLSDTSLGSIRKNVKALFINKIGVVIANGTDNIIISKFIGLVEVGIYSNYLLISLSLTKIVNKIFSSVTSSVGNLVATSNANRCENIFRKINFVNFWLYAFISVCLACLINPFITLWIGEDYALSTIFVTAFAIKTYILGMLQTTSAFRSAYGLFYKAKYRSIIMVVINLVLSVILAREFGIIGVVLGTIISNSVVIIWLEPYIIYKHGFKKSPFKYYMNYIMYFAVFIALLILSQYIFTFITINNIFMWIVYAIVLAVIVNAVLITLFNKTDEYKYLKEKGLNFIQKLTKRLNKKRYS